MFNIFTLTTGCHLPIFRWKMNSVHLPTSILILTYLRPGLPIGLFPSSFPTKILYLFFFSLWVRHALLTSFFVFRSSCWPTGCSTVQNKIPSLSGQLSYLRCTTQANDNVGVPLTTWPASRCGRQYQFTSRLGGIHCGHHAFKENVFEPLPGIELLVL